MTPLTPGLASPEPARNWTRDRESRFSQSPASRLARAGGAEELSARRGAERAPALCEAEPGDREWQALGGRPLSGCVQEEGPQSAPLRLLTTCILLFSLGEGRVHPT